MASCSGTTTGTEATTCPATAFCSRRWGRRSGRGWWALWPRWRRRGCSAPWPGTGMGTAPASPPCGSGPARRQCCSRAASPSPLGSRSGSGRCSPSRGRPLLAAALAVLTALASPVAGLFLAFAGVAVILAGDRRGGAAVAFPALAAVAALSLAFPTGGDEPFTFTAFIGVPLFALAALWLLPPEERALRWGVAVYVIASIVAFAVANPLRREHGPPRGAGGGPGPGAGARGPAAGGACGARPAAALLAMGGARPRPVRRAPETRRCTPLTTSRCSPSSSAARAAARCESRFRPPATAGRPTTWRRTSRSPAAGCASSSPATPTCSPDGNLTAAAYRSWLDDRGVSYVAVSDAKPDYLSTDEDALIRGGLPYLRPVWSDQHWRLYRGRALDRAWSPAPVTSPVRADAATASRRLARRASRCRPAIRGRSWSGSTTRATGR